MILECNDFTYTLERDTQIMVTLFTTTVLISSNSTLNKLREELLLGLG